MGDGERGEKMRWSRAVERPKEAIGIREGDDKGTDRTRVGEERSGV